MSIRRAAPLALLLASLAAALAFAVPATRGLPSDLASVTDRQSELAYALGMLARAVAGNVVVVIHATIEPAYAIPAAPARPTPRPFFTAAPARGGNVHRARKRRPESR